MIKHDVWRKRSEPKGVTGENKQRQQRYQPGLSLLIRRKAIDLLELWFDVCAVYVDEQWKILSVKQSMRTKKRYGKKTDSISFDWENLRDVIHIRSNRSRNLICGRAMNLTAN